RSRWHHLPALQNTFKIRIHSAYGYLGCAPGHFADCDAPARATQLGRDVVQQMITWVNERGAQVIGVDTDGVHLVPPDSPVEAGAARHRAAAYQRALAGGRNSKPGDRISYYIKATPKKVAAYEAAKLISEFDPQNRDDNVDYYVSKLDELVKKFGSVTANASS